MIHLPCLNYYYVKMYFCVYKYLIVLLMRRVGRNPTVNERVFLERGQTRYRKKVVSKLTQVVLIESPIFPKSQTVLRQ